MLRWRPVLADGHDDRAVWIAIAVLAAALPLQLAAGPHIFDAGELVAASWSLGGSHPPGQPLHALIAHAFARLPLGPIPARVALLSAACTVWAAWLGARITAELGAQLRVPPAVLQWARAAAILGVGLTAPVLRQALRVEVYTLSLALVLWSALHLMRWAAGAPGKHLAFAGFAAGLAAAAHPLHAAAAVLIGLALSLPHAPRLLARPRQLLWAALMSILGLLLYAYLPARALAGAAMWGDPSQLAGFVDYVTGKAYAHKTGAGAGAPLPARVGEIGLHALITGGGIGLLGLLLAWLRDASQRRLLGGLSLAGALALAPAWLVRVDLAIADHPGYFAPACALWIAAGAAALGALWSASRALSLLGLALLALSPYTLAHGPELARSDAPVLETLAGSLVDTPPPRALIVPTTDFAAGAWMMAQAVEGARPDVAVFIAGLSTSSWQWRQLARHPALDGVPRRGPGRDAHRQYLRGAITAALPHVTVALEHDLFGVPVHAIAGPYSFVGHAGGPRGLLARNLGERLQPMLAREAAAGPAGDSGAVAAIMRDQLTERGQRLLAAGQRALGMAALVDAAWPVDAQQRQRLLSGHADADEPLAVPHVVDDAASFLISRPEALRTLASALWAAGRREQAMGLLERQGTGGEPRALLQLAWLQLYDGQPDAARRTLDGMLGSAPELAEASRPLAKALARIAASPR